MSKSKSDPVEIQKLDRKRQVLNLLHQGVDVRAIAEQVGLAETYVAILAREEMQYLDLATQEMQQHFVSLTFARGEKIMSRIMPLFDVDPPTQEDMLLMKPEERQMAVGRYQKLIGEGLKNWALLVRVQKEILQVKSGAEKADSPSVNVQVNNITLPAQGDLYQEALDNIRVDTAYAGESFPELQSKLLAEGDLMQMPDDRLSKIEKAIDNLHVASED